MTSVTAQAVFYMIAASVAAVAFIGLVLGANALLSPRKPNADKVAPYECGMEQQGDPHVPIDLRFATIAVLFVIFDAESVLLFAVASRLHGSWAGVGAVGAFVGLLALGLAYAWRKGALAWRS
jgi:NADH-quinone oxidoreductase subunit A